MPSATNVPPDFGRRLIPQILDELALADPDRIIYSLTLATSKSYVFREVSAQAVANAVDRTAWWLVGQLGGSKSIQAVGYIGPHDLRHVLLTYACVKAGYAALFLSPKNNVEGALAVLDAAECNIWVKPREQSAHVTVVDEFCKRRPMQILDLPEIDELLNDKPVVPFSYTKSFAEALHDPFCIMHTSGTTGVPKPVVWSHSLIGTMDAVRLLPPTEGDGGMAPWSSGWDENDKIYSAFPMSHGAGVIMDIIVPALFALHCFLGPVGVLPNMHLVEVMADYANIDIWSMVPSLVDELGETPHILAKLKSSKFICASGGPVSPVMAAKVNKTIRVLNLTGTTEGLFIGNLWVNREDWHWFAFHPFSGFEFKEVEPGVFEQWAHRNKHWPLFQGIFHTFPSLQSYNFKDLYVRHPIKPNLWAFKGRNDDVVILSNGYKISPLDTESYIATHPAIEGCLMIGTGKMQPGLLIELKDPSSKNDELLESIWATVVKADTRASQVIRLHRDYIGFTEPDKPFIRTDKGTIKRHATLKLYADYIERFYCSRDEVAAQFDVDTDSVESITESVRQILASMMPAILDASPDTDIFGLGLDSLNVFQAIKIIQAAMGLQNQLAPRHLYANPTLKNFSAALAELAVENSKANGDSASTESAVDERSNRMKRLIEQHKARQSFKLNALDRVNPNHRMGLNFFFELREGIAFDQAYKVLQEGLRRTFDIIPALSGRIMNYSDQEVDYRTGDLCVTIPSLRSSTTLTDQSTPPKQLAYKDLSPVLPSFRELRAGGFAPSAIKDSLVLPENTFPVLPADILVAQANFVEGGCLLAADFHHSCLDGTGAMIALKVWAECCRFVQGDLSATCSWYDPESFNHSLPEIIYEHEGYARPAHEIDPGVWGFLPFVAPDEPAKAISNGRATIDGNAKNCRSLEVEEAHNPVRGTLPSAPRLPLRPQWPLPPSPHGLKTTQFLIPAEQVQILKQEVLNDPKTKGTITSISDIVQAFYWRAAVKARYRVATELRGEVFGPEDLSILELPVDGRPYFSSLLPSTYMGSMLIMNRSTMPTKTLCSPETSIGQVAYQLREAAARITPSLFHDAFTLLQTLPGLDRFSTANMGLEHMHAMISNLMLFQTSEIAFGDSIFAEGGSPLAMRPLIDRGSARFRFLVIYPMRSDGGVELVLGTRPEELEMFKADDEFTKYATLVDSC